MRKRPNKIIKLIFSVFISFFLIFLVYSVWVNVKFKKQLTGKLVYSNNWNIYIIEFPLFKKRLIYSLSQEEYNHLCLIGSVNLSPDGRKILFSKSKGVMKPHQLYLLDLDSKKIQQLINLERDCISPSWSPDGTKIAFLLSPGRKLHIFDFKTKQIKCLSQIYSMGKPSWSPDGQKIAFTAQRKKMLSDTAYTYYGEIYIIDLKTGGEEKIIAGSGPVWLPDGKRILYLYKDGFYSIDVINGGEPQKIYSSYRLGRPVLSPDGKFILYHLYTPSLWFPSDGFHILSIENPERKLRFGRFSGRINSISWGK